MSGRSSNILKALQAKQDKNFSDKLARVEQSKRYYVRRCEILETILADIDIHSVPPRSASGQESFFQAYQGGILEREQMFTRVSTAPQFYESFIDELINNARREPHGRRWSLPIVMLAFVVHSLGSKAYNYLRAFIPLPVRQTLFNHFGEPLNAWRESLLNFTQAGNICSLFRRRHNLADSEKIEVVLAVDAMAIQPVSVPEFGATPGDNHVFLFEILPLSCQLKPMSVHIMTQRNGNAGEVVIKRIGELKEILAKHRFKVRCIASDGDRGYDSLHRDMMSKWIGELRGSGLEAAVDAVRHYGMRVVGDFLHILKNARARMMNGRVTILSTGHFPFTAQDVNKILKLGRALTDNTSQGKMRDSYALEVFTLENCLRLVKGGHLHIAFYLLPYALWNAVVNNPSLSCQMRREMLSVVIDIFDIWANNMQDVNKEVVSINKNKGKVQFACSENHARRALNSLVTLLLEIERHPDNLGLDRIGTHPVECRFGMVRLLCHSEHTWRRVVKSFTKITLVNDCATILGKPLVIRERVNSGGVKVRSEAGIYIQAPKSTIIQVFEALRVIVLSSTGLSFGEKMIRKAQSVLGSFWSFIATLTEQCQPPDVIPPRLSHGSSVSHSTIMARLISFCHNPIAEDESSVDDRVGPSTEEPEDNFVSPHVLAPEFSTLEVPIDLRRELSESGDA